MRRLLLLSLVLLAGCASAPPPAPAPTQRPALPGQSPFALSGRISVMHDGKRDSSGLYWSHSAAGDDISLIAPLGQTVAHIVRNAQGATLDTSDRHYAAGNTGELMQQALGWTLPLDGLSYWVFALPAPDGAAGVEPGPNGQVAVLRQDGWDIRYLRYASASLDSLPLRLTLAREGLEIQLLVDTWDIPH